MTGLDTLVHHLSRRRALATVGAALASTPFATAKPLLARSQEETTGSTRTSEATSPETLSLVQYIHPEKVYHWVPGFSDEAVLAGLYELDVATYEEIKAGFVAAARRAAEELLADTSFAAQVDRLPFKENALVVAIGESDTDSLQSWFEIVRLLLDLRRPDSGIQLVNAGISAQTTTQAFRSLVPVLAQQPDWIICALGGNDAVRIGPEPAKTLVSIEETTRNLAELRRLADITTTAQWVWLGRMPIDQVRMDAYPPFQMGPVAFNWRNADLDAVNAWFSEQPDLVVSIHEAFGNPVPPEFQEPDGLHPTLAGHQAIAREFVERLASRAW
jgi:lysophospholipase L1-like esterase